MKVTTITLIQTVLALLIVVANAIFQTMSLLSLNKTTNSNADIDQAKKLLFVSIITQFIASLLLVIVAIVIIIYREKFQTHMNALIYFALIVGILLMLTGGSLGATAAFRMQCYRTDINVNSAWKQSMLTVLLGILGTMLTLIIHAFVRRGDIKEYLRTALTTKRITVPTHVAVETQIQVPQPVISKPVIDVPSKVQKIPPIKSGNRPPVRKGVFHPGLSTGYQP